MLFFADKMINLMRGISFILLFGWFSGLVVQAQSVLQKYESGLSLLEKGKPAEARTVFDEIIAMRPYYYDAWVGRGRAWMMEGDPQAALADYDKALEMKPGWYEAHYFRAVLHFENARPRQALADLEKCLQSEERHPQAWIMKGRILAASGQAAVAETAFSQAVLFGQGEVKATALLQRAILRKAQGRIGEAIEDVSNALKQSSVADSLFLLRAQWYEKEGDTAKAMADLSTFLQKHPAHTEARHRRAELQYRIGALPAARKDLDYLIGNHPRDARADWYELRAGILLAMKEADAAVADINKALALDRSREYLYLRRAEAYAVAGKDNAALADYRRLIRLGSEDPEPWIGRAKYYMKYQRWELAADDLSASLKASPTAEAHYQRAICYYELKENTKACQDLKAAADLQHPEAPKMLERFCR